MRRHGYQPSALPPGAAAPRPPNQGSSSAKAAPAELRLIVDDLFAVDEARTKALRAAVRVIEEEPFVSPGDNFSVKDQTRLKVALVKKINAMIDSKEPANV